ncbi:MAG: copper resistance protein CopC [Actinomycetota bacterium]
MLAHAGAADESLALLMLTAGLWTAWAVVSRARSTGFTGMPAGAAWALGALSVLLIAGALTVPRALFPPDAGRRTTRGRAPAVPPRRPPRDRTTTAGPDDRRRRARRGDPLIGGTVVDSSSTRLSPDSGHVHLSVDGEVVSMTYGLVQVVDVRGLAGEHTLEAEFVAADRGPFDARHGRDRVPHPGAGDVSAQGRRRRARACVAGLLAAVWLIVSAHGASAHANLDRSEPANGAQLDASPARISLTFTETPDAALSSIELLDEGGNAVTLGAPRRDAADPDTLVAPIGSPLADGTYTVAWRVVSVQDGHSTAGAFAFGVGEAPSRTPRRRGSGDARRLAARRRREDAALRRPRAAGGRGDRRAGGAGRRRPGPAPPHDRGGGSPRSPDHPAVHRRGRGPRRRPARSRARPRERCSCASSWPRRSRRRSPPSRRSCPAPSRCSWRAARRGRPC